MLVGFRCAKQKQKKYQGPRLMKPTLLLGSQRQYTSSLTKSFLIESFLEPTAQTNVANNTCVVTSNTEVLDTSSTNFLLLYRMLKVHSGFTGCNACIRLLKSWDWHFGATGLATVDDTGIYMSWFKSCLFHLFFKSYFLRLIFI